LKLRLSEQLSRDAEQRPRRAARAPRVRDRSGTLRLRLSRELAEPPAIAAVSPGAPRAAAPSPLATPAAQETELKLRLSEQLSPGAPRPEAPSPLATPAAQETELKLRLSEQLSPGAPRPEAPSPLATPLAQETELKLRLSEQLSPGAPRPEAPSPLATPAPPVPPAPQRVMELLLQVDVNRQQLDEPVLVLRREDGTLLIAGEDLDRWRLRRPSTPPYEHEGRLFYPSSDLPWLKLSLDERTQTLTISADPQAFAGTVQAVAAQRFPPPVLPQPGGFFNYTLSGTRMQDTSTRSGLFEAGFFSQHGVFMSSVLAPDLTRTQGWLRLDSTYAIDYPVELVSVRLGDTITRPGTWGRAVRIGGAQYGTNFGTQPGFSRSPVLQA